MNRENILWFLGIGGAIFAWMMFKKKKEQEEWGWLEELEYQPATAEMVSKARPATTYESEKILYVYKGIEPNEILMSPDAFTLDRAKNLNYSELYHYLLGLAGKYKKVTVYISQNEALYEPPIGEGIVGLKSTEFYKKLQILFDELIKEVEKNQYATDFFLYLE